MEEWKEIPGWHGKYLISNQGRFKSIKGKFKKKFPDGYITLGTVDSVGYYVVTMRRPGYFERLRIHSIMGNVWVDRPQEKRVCCINHKDGNKLNNRAENLEWCTYKENSEHAVKKGLLNIKGEKHPMSKITKEVVIEMRRLYHEGGLTHKQIGQKFGVCRRQAGDVINGVNWGWITDGLLRSSAQ